MTNLEFQERIDTIRNSLPELPWTTRLRLKETYALSDRDVDVLLNIDSGREVRYDGEDPGESGAVRYFDRLVEGSGNAAGKSRDPKVVANWYVPLPPCRRVVGCILMTAREQG